MGRSYTARRPVRYEPRGGPGLRGPAYSTVTLFARFLGWSTSVPFSTATW